MLSAEVVKQRIDELDLEPIKFKLTVAENYSAAEINVIDKWYRRFIFLAWKYPESQIVVPEPIDNMWHHHILDTRKYAEDCKTAFGEFLHHFPYFGLRGDDDLRALRTAYQKTNDLMEVEYGESAAGAMAQLRPEWSQENAASSCSDCSGVMGSDPSVALGEQIRPRFFAAS